MEQSVFGLKQHEERYKAFYNIFLAKICLPFARTQFLLKIIFSIIFPLYTSNTKMWNLWSQNLNAFFEK